MYFSHLKGFIMGRDKVLEAGTPTEKDLKDVQAVLRDFGIKIALSEIPSFREKSDLYRWQRSQIQRRLEKC